MEYYKNLNLEDIRYIDDDGIERIEQWKDIDDFIGRYQVSDLGRVKSLSRLRSTGKGFHLLPTRILRQTPDRDKYLLVGLRKPGINQKGKVHRLVAIAFIPNPLNLSDVNHKSITGTKTDNRVTELEWSTHGDNMDHAHKNKLINNNGEKSHSSKLSEKEVLEIRSSNLTHIELSKIYGVGRVTITNIINRHRWKHI